MKISAKSWLISGLTGVVVAITLGLPASAQTVNDIDLPAQPLANLNARLAYNSDLGAVVGLGVATDRLFGGDHRLRFGVEASEDSLRYNLSYAARSLFGDNPVFGLNAFAARTDADDVYGFDSSAYRLEPRLTWRVSESMTAAGYVAFSWGEISNVPATSSILIRNDIGNRQRQAVGVDLRWRASAGGDGRPNLRFGLMAEAGESDRDHSYVSLVAQGSGRWAVGANQGVVLRGQVRGGTIQSTSGTSHIGDRFFLGQGSIRGFAFGGFGPRDLAVADSPALGGNTYALARFDAQFPNAFGSGSRVTPGLFVDAGSLWDLDDTAGGVAGANPVDDAFNLRASIGVSFEFETGFGPVQLNLAHPVASENYDRQQEVHLTFRHEF